MRYQHIGKRYCLSCVLSVIIQLIFKFGVSISLYFIGQLRIADVCIREIP